MTGGQIAGAPAGARPFASGSFRVGYDYRQISDDSGAGARIGPFRGRVDAIGPGLTYTTLFGQTPFILNVRHYTEFNAHNRWDGSSTIVCGTLRF